MMDIRLECLKAAIASGADATSAIPVAEAFLRFLRPISQDLEHAQCSNDRKQQSGT